MPDHLLFLTGKLAWPSLTRVLQQLAPTPWTYEIRELGLSVAALMTTDLIRRRLGATDGVTRVIVPGRCRGDLEALSHEFTVPFERGPEELKDLPGYFGRGVKPRDLNQHSVRIFAEIVEAPQLDVAAILARAERYRRDGADVIDLGCLPDTPFPHLADAVRALKDAGYLVSVDSLEVSELLAGGQAGADYLLSLHEETLWVAEQCAATPVLIPREPTVPDSLYRAIDTLAARGRSCYADAILDPIHMGFTTSLVRYQTLRARYPEQPIMMGIGNLTELTHADTAGITALLMGVVSELGIGAILTTEVSPHCRRAVREADRARRIMHAARAEATPPRHIDDGLLALHERSPFPYSDAEIAALAAAVTDPNYRIQVSAQGIHLYNRDGLVRGTDPYEFYPHLEVTGDPAHAFYLGMELARAQIAWQLGKRYQQDEELRWGCAVDPPLVDLARHAPERSTRRASRRARKTRS